MKKWATPGHLGVTLSSNGLTNCLWVAHIAGTWSAEMGVLLDSITEVWASMSGGLQDLSAGCNAPGRLRRAAHCRGVMFNGEDGCGPPGG